MMTFRSFDEAAVGQELRVKEIFELHPAELLQVELLLLFHENTPVTWLEKYTVSFSSDFRAYNAI